MIHIIIKYLSSISKINHKLSYQGKKTLNIFQKVKFIQFTNLKQQAMKAEISIMNFFLNTTWKFKHPYN